MAIRTLKNKSLTWVNIDRIDETSLSYLKDNFHFHHLDLEDIQSESQSPKIDTYKNYFFIVVHFPHWDAKTKALTTQELDIFIGDGFLITIQHTKSKEMKTFFYRCMNNRNVKREWMSQNSGYLLYNLIDSLFKHSQAILNNIGKHLSALEREIFEGEVRTQTVKELAIHRRNVLSFRRIIDPQRYLLANLAHIRKPFLNDETSLYFDDIHDFLSKLWSIVDTYKETIEGFHVTVESLLTQKTNKVISALTVISVALLPFTVLSSIYGMNIEGLPYASNPIYVWAMFAVLAMIVFISIVVMKWKRWL